ncbi:MAG: GyrI-like domain-containing protein [Bacteroidetes bacterium]|nr:GyrI-like domain-containing protein [Bacteroidota bacterium]
MRTFTKVIIWIIAILVILVIISYLLPGKYYIERSVVINADKEIIFDQFCDYNNWENWTPWGKELDSAATIEFIGSCEEGAIQKWDGEIMGNGEMMITRLIPYEIMEYELKFDGGKYRSQGSMFLEPEEEGYRVTWTDEGDLGYNPITRYMGLMIDGMMGPDFEKGLNKLKEVAEGMPDFPDIEVTEVEPVIALSITDSSTLDQMGMKMAELYELLSGYITARKANITGPAYCVFHSWDPEGHTVIEAGFPVDKELPEKLNMKSTLTPGGKALKSLFIGPYDQSEAVYMAMDKYLKHNKLEMAGGPWEVYLNDPVTEPDPNKWETLIYFPIK